MSKPAPVQHRLRFTGTQIPPGLSVVGFHPSVIVIAVGPPGSVHLTGSDAHTAQSCHQESGLLPTTAKATGEHLQRRSCSAIGGAVGGFLGAPAVHFQDRLRQRKARKSWSDPVMKQAPAILQLLGVDPRIGHGPEKQVFRQSGAPRKFLSDLQRLAGRLQKESWGIIPHVRQGQSGVIIGEQDLFVLTAAGQGVLDLLPAAAKRVHPIFQLSLGVVQKFLGPIHCRINSFPAARSFSGSVRQSVYSLKAGSPMLTPSFR